LTVPAPRSRSDTSMRSRRGRPTSARNSDSRGSSAALERAARNARYAEERAAAVRAADPSRDPNDGWHRVCRALADECGLDVADVLDEWEERAAVREYCGETDRALANRLAFDDVLDRLRRQRSLL
jgi:hypothetical protein